MKVSKYADTFRMVNSANPDQTYHVVAQLSDLGPSSLLWPHRKFTNYRDTH